MTGYQDFKSQPNYQRFRQFFDAPISRRNQFCMNDPAPRTLHATIMRIHDEDLKRRVETGWPTTDAKLYGNSVAWVKAFEISYLVGDFGTRQDLMLPYELGLR